MTETKHRQFNLRMDEATFEQLRDLSAVIGEDSVAGVIRDLIAKAHSKLTPTMLETIRKQRSFRKSMRAKILGE